MDSAKPVGPDTLWRLYSMTKPITAMAAMLLIEEGKMGLDQPIADVLPAFAKMTVQVAPDGAIIAVHAEKAPITARQLRTHTAGRGYKINKPWPQRKVSNTAGLTGGQVARRTNRNGREAWREM